MQGELTARTDRNGTAHAFTFDVLGRPTVDAVIIPTGAPVDPAVQRLETAYDTYGNAWQFSSYSLTAGGTLVNQVQRTFDGFGRLSAESQNHGGTTPVYAVLYGYNAPAAGVNSSRQVSLTYPLFGHRGFGQPPRPRGVGKTPAANDGCTGKQTAPKVRAQVQLSKSSLAGQRSRGAASKLTLRVGTPGPVRRRVGSGPDWPTAPGCLE